MGSSAPLLSFLPTDLSDARERRELAKPQRSQKQSRRREPAGPRPQKLSRIALGEFTPSMFQ